MFEKLSKVLLDRRGQINILILTSNKQAIFIETSLLI